MIEFFRQLQADREIDIQFWKKHPELQTQLVDGQYPDEAHFVYELLQNAEDAGATTVEFELFDSRLELIHDGTRLFTERDVEAITDVSKTGKGDGGQTTIGRFGIGFKSVFKYTESPQIHSGKFSFEIVDFVCPKLIPATGDLADKTVFIFPFNGSKKSAIQAFSEIKAGLQNLSPTTLLFLRNLACISYKIEGKVSTLRRVENSEMHVEMVAESEGKKLVTSHWLRFTEFVRDLGRFTMPVAGFERHKIAIAFELKFKEGNWLFDTEVAIAEQLKIEPAKNGKVSVFFPAEKETSNLRFHLHAPFLTEPSRSSVKDSPENAPLYEQLAKLAAISLHKIKGLDLLTGDFLAVLPNSVDGLPKRYQCIRDAIINEMKVQPLVPTKAGSFAPAVRLVQGVAAMKEFLSDEDLTFLFGRKDDPAWAIAANQKGSHQERFLTSLGIVRLEVESLLEWFVKTLEASQPQERLVSWMSSKTDDWHQSLYAMLYEHLKERGGFERLQNTCIVRMQNGRYATGNHAYFADGQLEFDDPFPRASEKVLTTGTHSKKQESARNFLEKIGVRKPGEKEHIQTLLATRYTESAEAPSDEVHVADLKRFIDFLAKNPTDSAMFKSACFFKIEDDLEEYEWAGSDQVFLDSPFKATGLSAYYRTLKQDSNRKFPLASWYKTCGIDPKKLVDFAERVDCAHNFSDEFLSQVDCTNNPQYEVLSARTGNVRNTSTFASEDYKLESAVSRTLVSKSIDFSRLVWQAMCELDSTYLKARFRWNETRGYVYADSQLVHKLKTIRWIPCKDDSWVTPRQATRKDLLEGFVIDASYKWLDAVEFESVERAQSAETATKTANWARVGVKSTEDVQVIEEFLKLPASERKRVLDEIKTRQSRQSEEFPNASSRNRDLRNQRLREEAEQTPKKRYEARLRSVPVDVESAKESAREYLRAEYTRNRVMYCQVCKTELPFKRRNGEYYFEAVEISDDLGKRLRQTFLALCPNHAAMFKHANDQEKEMLDLVATSSGREIQVVLGGTLTTIQFTATHLADMKACLAAGEAD